MTSSFYKKHFTFLVLFLKTGVSIASELPDSSLGSCIIGVNYHYGFIVAHRPSIVPLQEEHLKGIEISLSEVTDGNKAWQRAYNYPTVGIKFNWFNLGNEKRLGNGYTLYPFLHFDFSHNKLVNLSLEYGFGIGYIEKVFNLEDNYKNIAIGSHINGIFNLNMQAQWTISKTTFLSTALGLTHFSNGSVTTPNLGINLATVQLGIRHYLGQAKKMNTDTLPIVKKDFHNSVNVAFAVKEIYPPGDKLYGAWIISGLRTKRLTLKSAAGFGVDIFYDYSIIRKLEYDTANHTNYFSGLRPGINLTYQLIQSDFSVLIQAGFYPYTQLKDDGYIYNRICLRYYFKNDLFATVNLKTHFAKADFVEWGIGKRF